MKCMSEVHLFISKYPVNMEEFKMKNYDHIEERVFEDNILILTEYSQNCEESHN